MGDKLELNIAGMKLHLKLVKCKTIFFLQFWGEKVVQANANGLAGYKMRFPSSPRTPSMDSRCRLRGKVPY